MLLLRSILYLGNLAPQPAAEDPVLGMTLDLLLPLPREN